MRIQYNKIVSNVAKEYGEAASISAYIDKVRTEIVRGVSPESIGIMVEKLNHKVGVKQAWDEADRKQSAVYVTCRRT